MKKTTLIAAVATVLLSGGMFMKVMTMNDSLIERNIAALTQDPAEGEGEGVVMSGSSNGYSEFRGPCTIALNVDMDLAAALRILGIPVGSGGGQVTGNLTITTGEYVNCERGGKLTSCTPITCPQVNAQLIQLINAIKH